MSILLHPDWPTLRPFLRVEQYARDSGRRGARVRLEVDRPEDGRILRRLLGIVMACVACGRPVHPIRERGGRAGLYFAPTCSLDVRFGCARGGKASREYLDVRAAVEAWRASGGDGPAAQGDLFRGRS